MREGDLDEPLSIAIAGARTDCAADEPAELDEVSIVRAESKSASNDDPHLEHDNDCSLFSVLH